jgi:hypothetical protein
MDADQAIYIFNAPGGGIFQDYDSIDWSGRTHTFAAKFEPGRAYTLTAGMIGGGGGMPEGATIFLSLNYRDANSNMVTVTSTSVVHSVASFPTTTHFVDFQVTTPTVKESDPWANRSIGISMLSVGPPEKPGGYWDIDNVRLASAAPTLPLGNPSFESPATSFVDLRIDAWQKNPKPAGFPVTDEQWDQGIGIFKNTAPGESDHIDNIDAGQALYIFNAPGAGIFQDYDSMDWNGQIHTSTATYEVGSSYHVTAAFVGGGGGMPEGATVLLMLHYRDGASNIVAIASTPIVHSVDLFPVTTHLVDFIAAIPPVKASDAWAGKHIGVSITSIGPPEKPGGYWDIDNIRVATGIPEFGVASALSGSNLRLSWPSAAGYQYQVRASADLITWTDVDAPQVGTGAPLARQIPFATPPATFFTVFATPIP